MTDISSIPIAPGAQPFFQSGGSVGVLLVHGYGGSIDEYRAFGDALHQRGYAVSGPRLAGHGQGVAVLGKSQIADWQRSVDEAIDALRPTCSSIILIGMSFGGVLAASAISRNSTNIAGLVMVNVPLRYRLDIFKRIFLNVLRLLRSSVPKPGLSVAVRRQYAYSGSTVAWPIDGLFATDRYLQEKFKTILADVRVPTLILRSLDDEYVDAASAQEMMDVLPMDDKTVTTLPGRGHRPFRNPESAQAAQAAIIAFIEQVAVRPKR